MKIQKSNQEYQIVKLNRLILLLLCFFFIPLISQANTPKTYEEALTQWTSYEDVAKWLEDNFSYDMNKLKNREQLKIIKSPQDVFSSKRGICGDATRLAVEAMNHINPSYEAAPIHLRMTPEYKYNHFVSTFKMDGKLYIMDYGLPKKFKAVMGVHGPYESLDEYKSFFEKNNPDNPKIHKFVGGWQSKILK